MAWVETNKNMFDGWENARLDTSCWYLHVFEGLSTSGSLSGLVRDTVCSVSRLIFSPIKSIPIPTELPLLLWERCQHKLKGNLTSDALTTS